MPYTHEVMEDSDWSIGLIARTPQSILEQIDIRDHAFATLIVTPLELDLGSYTDPATIGEADHCGVFLEQTDGGYTLSGRRMVWWFGDQGDGGSMYVDADATTAAMDLGFALDDLVANQGIGTTGVITTTTRSFKTLPGTTERQLLDTIVASYPGGPYEWVERYSSTLGFLISSYRRGTLWPTTDRPTVILAQEGGYGVTAGTQKYLALDGTGDYAQAPDAAALDITGDIDIRAKVRLDDYTAAANQVLVSKWDTTGNQRAYSLNVLTTGQLRLIWSTNGTATLQHGSTTAAFTDGVDYWVRATLDVNDGAGNRVAKFYYSADTTNAHEDVTWTLLDTVTTAGTTSIFASTAAARVSGIAPTANEMAGRCYAAAILNGIADAGTVVADPNFTAWSPGDTTGVDAAGNTWTLNGNAYIAGQESVAITGLPAVLEVPSIDASEWRSDVVAGDPNTVIVGSATNTAAAGWANPQGTSPVLRSFIASSPRVQFQDQPRKWGARIGASKYSAWALNSAAAATRVARRAADQSNSYAATVTAEVDCEAIGRFIECGDTVYVWDLENGLTDNSNEVQYRAEPAHPQKLRVQRMEVPVTEGMGVYMRVWDGVSAFEYVDLTRYVDFEEGPARLELGTKARLHQTNARPKRLDRGRIRRWARQHYLLARWLGTSP